ncbi:uncharacterized protein LOC143678206 [Tamandua tetradactyla]|uniref:uncharacterized protein LOC143678206 n=1 Tax=Tamandua tetradactyla TaxID=48850 RepID=UPI00405486C4
MGKSIYYLCPVTIGESGETVKRSKEAICLRFWGPGKTGVSTLPRIPPALPVLSGWFLHVLEEEQATPGVLQPPEVLSMFSLLLRLVKKVFGKVPQSPIITAMEPSPRTSLEPLPNSEARASCGRPSGDKGQAGPLRKAET